MDWHFDFENYISCYVFTNDLDFQIFQISQFGLNLQYIATPPPLTIIGVKFCLRVVRDALSTSLSLSLSLSLSIFSFSLVLHCPFCACFLLNHMLAQQRVSTTSHSHNIYEHFNRNERPSVHKSLWVQKRRHCNGTYKLQLGTKKVTACQDSRFACTRELKKRLAPKRFKKIKEKGKWKRDTLLQFSGTMSRTRSHNQCKHFKKNERLKVLKSLWVQKNRHWNGHTVQVATQKK